MPKTPPVTASVVHTKTMQARRLKALRHLVERFAALAAEAAGVSPHSWGRYENGQSEINPIALAAFCRAYQVPSEWVITGRLSDMPEHLVLKLFAKEGELVSASIAETMAAKRAFEERQTLRALNEKRAEE